MTTRHEIKQTARALAAALGALGIPADVTVSGRGVKVWTDVDSRRKHNPAYYVWVPTHRAPAFTWGTEHSVTLGTGPDPIADVAKAIKATL